MNKKDVESWASLKSIEAGLDGSVYQKPFEDGFISAIDFVKKRFTLTPICQHDWVSSVAYKGAKVCTKCKTYQ